MDVGESYGSPKGRAGFSALYAELTGNWKFAQGILQRQNTDIVSGKQAQKLKMKV